MSPPESSSEGHDQEQPDPKPNVNKAMDTKTASMVLNATTHRLLDAIHMMTWCRQDSLRGCFYEAEYLINTPCACRWTVRGAKQPFGKQYPCKDTRAFR